MSGLRFGGASFAPEPAYFDPDNICRLAHEGGCNAVASTIGVLGSVARKWAHKIPFLAKFNHNEMLTYPNVFKQSYFGSVRQCFEMGAVAVGAERVAQAVQHTSTALQGLDTQAREVTVYPTT
jgi:class I fructose-bisphosphate aldolase